MSACRQNTQDTSKSPPPSRIDSSTSTTVQAVEASNKPPGLPPTSTVNAATFTEHGGCEQAAFWATNESQTIALLLFLPVGDKRPYKATLDAAVVVRFELQRGTGLRDGQCNDAADGSIYRVQSVTAAVAGVVTVEIRDDPTAPCGTHGALGLRNVTFDDGTEMASLEVDTDSIGCHTG
jgi:hypothetical protein